MLKFSFWGRILGQMSAGLLLLCGGISPVHAEPENASLRVQEIWTSVSDVKDLRLTDTYLWALGPASLDQLDRKTKTLVRRYTALNGLPSAEHARGGLWLSAGTHRQSVTIEYADLRCQVKEEKVTCQDRDPTSVPKTASSLTAGQPRQRPTYMTTKTGQHLRVVKQLVSPEGTWTATAGGGIFLDDVAISANGLVGPHVTSLAVFGSQLWYGTFNHGLGTIGKDGALQTVSSATKMINALHVHNAHLYVGTSQGLFRLGQDGTLNRIDFVEDAVVGLSSDGTSVWATTPGALYRIKDGAGPPTDVWWLPGGSRSLQKVSATPGFVWMATEDRGAVLMKTTKNARSKDKPFFVFDQSTSENSSWNIAPLARSDGSAWLLTLRNGAVHVSSDTQQVTTVRLPHNWGLSALETPGFIWFGTQGGVYFQDQTRGAMGTVTGLPHGAVHVLFADPRPEFSHRVWIGTEAGLAWVSAPQVTRTFSARSAAL